MDRQTGVVSRRQVRAAGGDDVDIRNMVRRREWARVHEGVYVDHTGPLTRSQRVWAAVLLHWPAAVHRQTALELYGLRRDRRTSGPDDPVWVVIDAERRSPAAVPGVRVERVRDAATWLTSHRWPPRVTVELALLKVASQRDLAGAVAVLADGCQQGRTDVPRLVAALERLGNLPGRAALAEVLHDVAAGAYSVLERRYLRDVERAHGLPTGLRQVRESPDGRVVVRDVKYAAQGVLVELDGRFGHRDLEDRWADLDRDLTAAVRALLTVRLGWSQVLAPCRVATAIATILRARGWRGTPVACRPGCPVAGSWAVAAN
jgi:hypothetical protein